MISASQHPLLRARAHLNQQHLGTIRYGRGGRKLQAPEAGLALRNKHTDTHKLPHSQTQYINTDKAMQGCMYTAMDSKTPTIVIMTFVWMFVL